MFIHFGLYSHLGGVWDKKNIDRGYSEQIQAHAGIYSDTYAEQAAFFNPSNWNADSIALLAKRAGMRSIVITSKHHDGFCMFKTATTDFNIVDATPFKRDVLKELSEACKRHGLNFGLYFSLIDWHYPQAYPISSHNADFMTPEHHEYNKKQLTELVTNYGSISELWFDMGSLSYKQSKELRDLVKQYQPGCMISGRLGNDQGDFCVMGDNAYPEYSIDVPWQVPASMYDETWGYRSWQKHVPVEDKSAEKLASLVRTVARGGNYILNIGPKGDGSVVDFEKSVLMEIGDWLRVNGEAIYGTRSITSVTPDKGEISVRDNKLYLFVFDNSSTVAIKGIQSNISKVYPLDDPATMLEHKLTKGSLSVTLPPSKSIRVIVIECAEKIAVKEKRPLAVGNSTILNSRNALKHYSFSGVDYYGSYRSTTHLSWNMQSAANKKVSPVVYYSNEEKDRNYVLMINGKAMPLTLSGGEEVLLKNGDKDVSWGKAWVSDLQYGFIHDVDPDPKNLVAVDWDTDVIPFKAARMFQNVYYVQEVTASRDTEVMIETAQCDGVTVYLNGQELYTINNPEEDRVVQNTVLLPLRKGTNKLLVKYFNRFSKQIPLGIVTKSPQVLYKLTLPGMMLEKGKVYEMDLKLPSEYPVHKNIHAPNLSIRFSSN